MITISPGATMPIRAAAFAPVKPPSTLKRSYSIFGVHRTTIILEAAADGVAIGESIKDAPGATVAGYAQRRDSVAVNIGSPLVTTGAEQVRSSVRVPWAQSAQAALAY